MFYHSAADKFFDFLDIIILQMGVDGLTLWKDFFDT